MKFEFVSLQQWWDFGKVQMVQLCQQYTQNVKKGLESEVEEL